MFLQLIHLDNSCGCFDLLDLSKAFVMLAFKWNWLTDIKATFEVQTIHICTSVLVSGTFQFH